MVAGQLKKEKALKLRRLLDGIGRYRILNVVGDTGFEPVTSTV